MACTPVRLGVRSIPPAILKRLVEAERLFDAQRFQAARPIYESILKQMPGQINALLMLARIRMIAGEHAGALELARKAIAVEPENAGAQVCLGSSLLAIGNAEESAKWLESALSLGYNGSDAYATLTSAWCALGREGDVVVLTDGIDAESIAREPTLALNRGSALLTLGKVNEAIATYAQGIKVHPGDWLLRSTLLTSLNYAEDALREDVTRAHAAFGTALDAANPPDLDAAIGVMVRVPDPARVLRVGLLSPDLRDHSVAWFVAPLLRHMDTSRVRLVCISTFGGDCAGDAITARLRSFTMAQGGEWVDVPAASPIDLATKLRALKLDILIELSGHTHGSRLRALSMRGAPIQMTYLGYPNTTGVSQIDYRIVDSITDPSPDADHFATEQLLRLDPCFVCFGANELGQFASPQDKSRARIGVNGRPITFGSFNAVQKVGPRVLALWRRVLDAVPGSKLALKGLALGHAAAADALWARIAAAGIDRSRVDLYPPDARREDHLARYATIDIALDTFPYHGTTTTCQALSMGVPVVTLMGDRHASRVGGSLLNAAGCPELLADSEDAFVHIASQLALDSDLLSTTRSRLVAGFATSTLCDGPGLCARFESLLRSVWATWCTANPTGFSKSSKPAKAGEHSAGDPA